MSEPSELERLRIQADIPERADFPGLLTWAGVVGVSWLSYKDAPNFRKAVIDAVRMHHEACSLRQLVKSMRFAPPPMGAVRVLARPEDPACSSCGAPTWLHGTADDGCTWCGRNL